MSLSPNSDDVIRMKAYQLWEARGSAHGGDLDDWIQAAEALRNTPSSESGATGPAQQPAEHPHSPASFAKGINEGFQSVSTMASGAVHAMAEFFGMHPVDEKPAITDAPKSKSDEDAWIMKLKSSHRSHHVAESITDQDKPSKA